MNKIIRKIKDWYLINISRKLTEEDCIRLIIDNELRQYNVNMDYVFKNSKIDGENWWWHFTFDSKEESLAWENFSKKLLRKTYTWADESIINKKFQFINLMWGLRTNYDIEDREN